MLATKELRRLVGLFLKKYVLLFPDPWIRCLPFACRAALKVIREESPKTIYTAGAPYTAHLVGLPLKWATGLPWVADFRDEWSQNPLIRYRIPLFGLMNEFMEMRVLHNANRVVA